MERSQARWLRNAGFGLRYILALIKKHRTFGPSRSPATTSMTPPCCRNCWARSHPAKRSAALLQTAHMTRGNATRRSLPSAPRLKPETRSPCQATGFLGTFLSQVVSSQRRNAVSQPDLIAQICTFRQNRSAPRLHLVERGQPKRRDETKDRDCLFHMSGL